MSDRLVLQLLFEARIPVRSRRGVCQRQQATLAAPSQADRLLCEVRAKKS